MLPLTFNPGLTLSDFRPIQEEGLNHMERAECKYRLVIQWYV